MAIAISVPAAGVTGAAQAAPRSGSQQKVVVPAAAYIALSFILSHGGA